MSWPRIESLPYLEDSAGYFNALSARRWPVWLDSGRPANTTGRYDLLAADPAETLQLSAHQAALAPSELRRLLGRIEPMPKGFPAHLPFNGGLIGFLSYELGRAWMGFEPVQRQPLCDDLCVGRYDWAVLSDHLQRQTWLLGIGRDLATRTGWKALRENLLLASKLPGQPPTVAGELLESGLSEAAYASAFARLQSYILEGDTYQVNLTRRWRGSSPQDPWQAYRQLREISPAPFGGYLDVGEYQVLSNSPEQFLSLRGRQVVTRPIKGTRPRSNNSAADRALLQALTDSAKDRAENLMIVDLLRNDLGKVCRAGSIEVPQLFAVESFATVHHMVSEIRGELREQLDAIDLLQACFPGGSITGAPKYRAMQIIDELEPIPREIYCGSLFHWGYDGSLNSSITIRTLLHRAGDYFYWSGGGVVADSECAAEYQESLDKAAAFARLLNIQLGND